MHTQYITIPFPAPGFVPPFRMLFARSAFTPARFFYLPSSLIQYRYGITEAQYERIAPVFPVQRGNVRLSNLQVLNAMLYVAEQGCKWRGLPSPVWQLAHSIHSNEPWSKNGCSTGVRIPATRTDSAHQTGGVSMDSTIVKVHPDGTGALKKNGPQSIGKSRGGWTTSRGEKEKNIDHASRQRRGPAPRPHYGGPDRQPAVCRQPEPRCACVLVVDTSGSMAGPAIEELNSGLKHFKECLTADTLASLRTEIAVVSYNNSPTVVHDFTTVDLFDPPPLTAGGGTVHVHRHGPGPPDGGRTQADLPGQPDHLLPTLDLDNLRRQAGTRPTRGLRSRAGKNTPGRADRLAAVYVVGVEGADMSVLNTITQRTEALMLRSLDFRSMFEWLASSMSSVSQSQPSDAVQLSSPLGWGTVPE